MNRNTSITLDPHFEEFVRRQLDSGRYRSTSEVIRAGLRALEDQESKLAVLRQLIDEGDSGGLAEYSRDRLVAELDQETGA